MSENNIARAVDDLQIMYLKVIDLIKDKEERNIIHCLFQDLSDKLLDNQKGESNAKLD
jgi:hypothetical protein|tara:strand:+ start:97 stop:270 length:174 start_codon:yes stop_codon:yes gene_type:complete